MTRMRYRRSTIFHPIRNMAEYKRAQVIKTVKKYKEKFGYDQLECRMYHERDIKIAQGSAHIYEEPAYMLNPPPLDGNCNICGRNILELATFTEKFIELSRELEIIIAPRPEVTGVTSPFLTPEYKLTKTFRTLGTDCWHASWECKDCYILPDEEANQQYISRNFG